MRDKKKIISAIGFVILLVVGMCVNFIFDKKEIKEVVANELPKEEVILGSIKVDIKGAVKKPGVYEVNEGDRVADVISASGGLKKGANTNFVNLGKRVFDEMTIWIYTDKEVEELKLSIIEYMEVECDCPSVENSACTSPPNGNNNGEANSKININTATLEQLMTLPGIGESKAKAIIDYRNKQLFKTIEEMQNVSGIGAASYENLKDLITV